LRYAQNAAISMELGAPQAHELLLANETTSANSRHSFEQGDHKGSPIRLNLRTSPSPSVGARAVGSGREGLYGRPISIKLRTSPSTAVGARVVGGGWEGLYDSVAQFGAHVRTSGRLALLQASKARERPLATGRPVLLARTQP